MWGQTISHYTWSLTGDHGQGYPEYQDETQELSVHVAIYITLKPVVRSLYESDWMSKPGRYLV